MAGKICVNCKHHYWFKGVLLCRSPKLDTILNKYKEWEGHGISVKMLREMYETAYQSEVFKSCMKETGICGRSGDWYELSDNPFVNEVYDYKLKKFISVKDVN